MLWPMTNPAEVLTWTKLHEQERTTESADRNHQRWALPRKGRTAAQRAVDCHQCRRRIPRLLGREEVPGPAAICALPLRPVRPEALLRWHPREGSLRRH